MATKKITELPLIQTISGSFSVVPIVIGNTAGNGTTDQITIENFSKFVTAYSAHTGSAGNTFVGPQIINNNVTINGRLTVTEVVAQYETASILFSTGSTKLGDQLTDKHEFTGSTNITGSVIYNGVILTNIDANTIQKLQQATASIELASASFNYFYQSTASLNTFTASQDSRNFTLSQVTASFNYFYQATASLQTFTSSQADRNLVLSTVTGSINQATASIQVQTASLLQFTASQDSRNFTLSQVTASFNYFYQATASLQTFTSSQADRNLVLSIVTGSINQATESLQFQSASVNAQLGRIQQATASLELASASFKYFYQSTASLQTFTASQDSRNLTLSTVTGSLIGITNGLMAFTAALDNTYATDAQLYQLYQSTRSLELLSGSLIGITNGLMAFTAALDNTYATDAQLYQLYQATRSLELHSGSMVGVTNGLMSFSSSQLAVNLTLSTVTGSLIGITNGLMAFTAALDSTYATDAQLYQLYAETASIKAEIGGIELYTASLKAASIVSSSTQVQNYDVFALNSNLYNSTGSIKGEIAGIEAYTASLKGAAIVSSSQQVQNYFTFAQTSSANTFYGNQSISGTLTATTSTTGATIKLGGFTNYGTIQDVNDVRRIWFENVGSYRTIFDLPASGSSFAFRTYDGTALFNVNSGSGASVGTGDLTITDGNVVMASGHGIDFSATSNSSGTMTSELLNDYEEGTWSPTDASGATLTFTVLDARYTKIGRQVQCFAQITYPSTADTNDAKIGGLPFTAVNTSGGSYGAFITYTNFGSNPTFLNNSNTTNTSVYTNAGAAITNATLSIKQFRLVWIYEV